MVSLCFPIFFHPDCTVGFGVSPNHALRLVGCTTGRESHPSLKNSYLFYKHIICTLRHFVKVFLIIKNNIVKEIIFLALYIVRLFVSVVIILAACTISIVSAILAAVISIASVSLVVNTVFVTAIFFAGTLSDFHGKLDALLFEVNAHNLHIYYISYTDSLKRVLDIAVTYL